MVADVKATVTNKNDNDRGAVIKTVKKLKDNYFRVYYSFVGDEVNITSKEQFGRFSVTFYSTDHLYFHHLLDDKHVQLFYKCDINNSVRMIDSNNVPIDEEK